MSDTTPETPQPQEQEIPAFTPDDLLAAVGLIDEGINQGAYKGWELVQRAAAVRQRFLLFSQHWQNQINNASAETFNSASGANTDDAQTEEEKV